MSNNRKCRSCVLAKKYSSEQSKHRLVSADFTCPLCEKKPKWYSHLNSELVGDALECKLCHNYIIYVTPDGVWKDEIYLFKEDHEVLVMRSFEDTTTYVSLDDEEVTTLQHILQFKSTDDLLSKVQTILVFS